MSDGVWTNGELLHTHDTEGEWEGGKVWGVGGERELILTTIVLTGDHPTRHGCLPNLVRPILGAPSRHGPSFPHLLPPPTGPQPVSAGVLHGSWVACATAASQQAHKLAADDSHTAVRYLNPRPSPSVSFLQITRLYPGGLVCLCKPCATF